MEHMPELSILDIDHVKYFAKKAIRDNIYAIYYIFRYLFLYSMPC